MKLIVDQEHFDRALASVARVIAPQVTMPILGGIQITARANAVTVTATDLFLTATATVPAEVTEPGTVVLPAALLTDLVHRIPTSQVAVTTDAAQKATIRYGSNYASLLSFGTEVLPEFDAQGENPVTWTLSAETLGTVARQLLYACGKDDTRPLLRGVALNWADGRAEAATTDGNRLSLTQLPLVATAKRAVIMPAKALAEAARLNADADVMVTLGQNFVRVATDAQTVTARLLDGTYPDVQRVIPRDYEAEAVVNLDVIRGAVERIYLLATLDRAGAIRVQLHPDHVVLSATAAEFGQAEETVPCTTSGAALDLSFNPHYLLDALKSFAGETVCLAFAGAQAPLQLQDPDTPGYAHYLLPLRQLSMQAVG